MVNTHILHNKKARKHVPLELLYEMVAEGLFSDAGQDIQAQAKSTSADRLTGRNQFPHRTVTNTDKTESKMSAHLQRVCEHR
jgi:hypothetical protein